MKEYIETRCQDIARYVIQHKCTVRAAAKQFNVSKSTIHKDLTERLPEIHTGLYLDCQEVLQHNKDVRHIRGGEATANKYRLLKELG